MKTFLALLFTALSVFAADPAQPKVGQTPVINATNGYGGTLTIRTQINVGYPTQTGLITLSDAGTITVTIDAGDDGVVYAGSFSSPTVGLNNKFGFQDLSGAEFPSIYYGGNPILGVGSRVFIPYLTDNRLLLAEQGSGNVVTDNGSGVFVQIGTGDPDGVLTANSGALFLRVDGGTGTTLYVKESDTGSSDWNAVGSGGGGDTIWTNNAGLIELIGSTDIILNPTVADGPSAVAFSLNSSNTLSTSGAKLLTVGNGGKTVNFTGIGGGLAVGEDFENSATLADGDALFGAFRRDLTGVDTYQIKLTADDSLSYNFGASSRSTLTLTDANNVYASFAQTSYGSIGSQLLLENGVMAGIGYGNIQMDIGGTTVLLLRPTEINNLTPYIYDTPFAHTDGNQVEVRNGGGLIQLTRFDGSYSGGVGAPTFGGLSINSPDIFYFQQVSTNPYSYYTGTGIPGERVAQSEFDFGVFPDPALSIGAILTYFGNVMEGNTNIQAQAGTEALGPTFNSFSYMGSVNSFQGDRSISYFQLKRGGGIPTYTIYSETGPLVIDTLDPISGNGIDVTSGNIAEFKNNGTNKMELSYKGFLTLTDVSGNTAGIGMNASGQMILQASDGSGTAITGNQMVPLGGVTMSLGSANTSTKWTDLALSQDLYLTRRIVWNGTTNTVWDLAGSFADPNGNAPACSPGSTYRSFAGGASTTFWVKESGVSTQTGWVGK